MPFTVSGWSAETLAYWLARLRAAVKAECELKTDAEVADYRYVLARLLLVIANEVTGMDASLAATFSAMDPSAAFGRMLDIAGFRLGVPRLAAARSVLNGRVYGTPGVVLNGELVRAEDQLWQIGAVTIGVGGYADVQARAVGVGPVEVPILGVADWTLVDQVTGWTGFASLEAVSLGRETETDDLYLARIAAAEGVLGGTEAAIRTAIGAVSGIGVWTVTVNRTNDTSPDGIPAHYVEVVATGATDLAIALALLGSASGTAGFHGNTLVQCPPFQTGGGTIPVRISRPEQVRCWADITLYENPTAAQAEAQIVAGLPKGCVVDVEVTLNRDDVSALTSVEILAREYARVSNGPSPAIFQSVEQGPFAPTAAHQVVIRSAGVDGTAVFDGSELTRDLVVARIAAAAPATWSVEATNNGSFRILSAATGASADLEVRAGSTLALLVELGLPLAGTTASGANTDITVGVV